MLFTTFITLMLLATRGLASKDMPDNSDESCPPEPDSNSTVYKDCRRDICKMIKDYPSRGPTLVRLSWHASGTYSKITNDGGSYKGTIRFKDEVGRGSNVGLAAAEGWLIDIYLKYNKINGMTYADLYTLAGSEAISCMGGPKIEWKSGRMDSTDERDIPPDYRLPSPDMGSMSKTTGGLRERFNRMGLNDQEIVAISGAHSIGRSHLAVSNYKGQWTPDLSVFSNNYFVILRNNQWIIDARYTNGQFTDKGMKGLFMLPSDVALLNDSSFNEWVDIYAQDKVRFFRDFAITFQKILELGCYNLMATD